MTDKIRMDAVDIRFLEAARDAGQSLAALWYDIRDDRTIVIGVARVYQVFGPAAYRVEPIADVLPRVVKV